jgi:hypothetical protein
MAILDYAEVQKHLIKRAYVLLGNGFSIGCDPVFSYGSLYEAARQAGLSDQALQIFELIGTNNFERVLRALDDAEWIGGLYGLPGESAQQIRNDVGAIKQALVEAVARSHLPHSGMVSDAKKEAALRFLTPFHHVFTTNYDLVLYWVIMHRNPVPFGDGFGNDEDNPDAPHVIFLGRSGGRPNVFFLHGALHLHLVGSELRKHCWNRTQTPLTELIRAGLEKREYPLFIAEGASEKKLQQVETHGYLWDGLQKLARLESPLVVYGHALGASDQHLVDAIVKSQTENVFIGLYGDVDSPANCDIRRNGDRMQARRAEMGRRPKPLRVDYYHSESARVWDVPSDEFEVVETIVQW